MTDIAKKPSISEQDYMDSAHELGCKAAAVKAVASVESSGSGFLPTGELMILFEPHVFWRQLKKKGQDPAAILKTHPELSDVLYEKYKGHEGEHPSQQWDRLRKAANAPYDGTMEAAYEATSFGKFQIMGFNYKAAGYRSVFEFVHFMDEGERYQLKSFVKLIKGFGLSLAMATENWEAFAKTYNGPAYKGSPATVKDDYDYKLAQAFKKYAA